MNGIPTLLANRFSQRLLIFLCLWLVLVPLLFSFLADSFHLNQYAKFAYPTVITPVILLVLYLFNRNALETFAFPYHKKQTAVFLLLAILFFGLYLGLYPIIVSLYTQNIQLSSWVQLGMVYGTKTVLYGMLFLAVFSLAFVKQFKRVVSLFFPF